MTAENTSRGKKHISHIGTHHHSVRTVSKWQWQHPLVLAKKDKTSCGEQGARFSAFSTPLSVAWPHFEMIS